MYFSPRTEAPAEVRGEKYMLRVLNYIDESYVTKRVAKNLATSLECTPPRSDLYFNNSATRCFNTTS